MARYSYTVHREFPWWVGSVHDHKSLVLQVSSKGFLTRRRATRWAMDERHTLEREAWARRVASIATGTDTAATGLAEGTAVRVHHRGQGAA